jgi:hypothetical protein
MVVIRRKWPRPGTSEIVDQSEDLGPGGAMYGRVSNGGGRVVGDMIAPTREYLAGLSVWASQNPGEPSALTVVRSRKAR